MPIYHMMIGDSNLMQVLQSLFLALLSIFLGTYITYIAYAWRNAQKPWKLRIDKNFQPHISILVPVHNEERTIESKLSNIRDVLYPKEKVELIVADDASEDDTLLKVQSFMKKNSDLNLKVVRQKLHSGKSVALNKALEIAVSEIIIVSDADTQWPSDILQKSLPYLSDSSIGAITGMGLNRNSERSWVTKAENTYLHLAYLLRLGQSKIYSTIRFEGGFCAYKKNAFHEFDCETGADDSGTALDVIQNNCRAILVPEAIFYTEFPTRLIDKLKVKARRANQLVGLNLKFLRFLLEKRLLLPRRIAVPEIMLFIFNPIILFTLIATGMLTLILFPFSLFSLAILIVVGGMLLFARNVFVEVLLDNLILLYALISFIFGRRYVSWEKAGTKHLVG